ncbi:hypothetical protein [Actinomadura flavalba]|uniref:hypothetical protein n=1 Tax=Actinomadura flavalba TaxID=1120938 RepID=UPI00035EBC52|nr:hypothetical protein [Actinomadura flavalba]
MEIPWSVPGAATGDDALIMASRFELAGRWRGPAFLVHALRVWRQARRSPGALGVGLRAHPLRGEYWTLSAWDGRAALTAYSRADPHAAVRDRTRAWTADSRFVFWTVPAADLPTGRDAAALWAEAGRRVASDGVRPG